MNLVKDIISVIGWLAILGGVAYLFPFLIAVIALAFQRDNDV